MTLRGVSDYPPPLRALARFAAAAIVLAFGPCAGAVSAETARDAFGEAVAAYRAGNHGKALEGWRTLADEANPLAQYNVGLLHYQGHGTTRSYAQALIWFHAAARQGLAASYLRLGTMFERGEGVPRDSEQAYLWYTLAVSAFGPGSCRDMALTRRRQLAEKLTEAQVLKVLAESSEWAPAALASDGQPCFESIAGRPVDGPAETAPAAARETEKAAGNQEPTSAPGPRDSAMASKTPQTHAPSTEKALPMAPALMSKLPARMPTGSDSSRRPVPEAAGSEQAPAAKPDGAMRSVDMAKRDVDTVRFPDTADGGRTDSPTEESTSGRREQANFPQSTASAKTETGGPAPSTAAVGESPLREPGMPLGPSAGGAVDSHRRTEAGEVARALPSQRSATPSRAHPAKNEVYVQLAALSTRDMADRVWRRLHAGNGDIFGGQRRKIETARMRSGKILYRLLTGPFDNVGEADAFCDALKRRDEACFVPRKYRLRN